MSECMHGAVPGGCHLCRGDTPQTPSKPTIAALFYARYPGTCAGCGFTVDPGARAAYVNHGDRDLLYHARCTP